MKKSSLAKLRLMLGASTAILSFTAVAAAQNVTLSMPEQPLSESLKSVAQQTGENILFQPDAVAGLRAAPLNGAMDAKEAVNILTRGTNLQVVPDGSGGLIVRPPVAARRVAAAPTDTAGGAGSEAETVVVTGSHITTPGFTAPTPVTSMSQQFLQTTATVSTDAIEYQIPQLIPSIGFRSAQGSPGATTFNLRGLGSTRTLLLLDGHRTMPTSYDGTTDANILPVSLIKRVDTVTGGASAAYGSDAVAGVVNIILDNTYEGLKGRVQVGETQYHDNKETDLTTTFGTAFAGGKGHFVVSGELYSNSGGDGTVVRRHWAQYGYGGLVPNPLYAAGVANGQPQMIVIRNAMNTNASLGGLIVSGPLKGVMFGPGGLVQQIQYGTFVGSTFMQGGSYADGKSAGGNKSAFTPSGTGDEMWDLNDVDPRQGRQSLYAHVSYDISDAVTLWGQGIVISQVANSLVARNLDLGTLTIRNDNPYLPASVLAQMAANKLTTFAMGRFNAELGANYSNGTNNYVNWSLGANGKFGGGWTWDVTAQFAANNFDFKLKRNRNNPVWLQSIDVIANPAAGGATGVAAGAPICRSNLANANPSCMPIDIFGVNTITETQAALLEGTSWNEWPQESWDVAANIQGILFKNWAGDVSVAAGGEARRLSLHGIADPGSIAAIWQTNNTLPFGGQQEVEEGYVETDLPLLADMPYAEQVGLNGAFRYTNYSLSGGTETWKLGLNWTVNDDLRIRATNSRDLRAPTLNDLFSAGKVGNSQFTDRLLNQQYGMKYTATGNANLVPEVGITNTAGVVYSPSWLPGLQTSIDYWNINLHKGIVLQQQQSVIDGCYVYGQSNLCAFLTRDPVTHLITFINGGPVNISQISVSGVDFEADYGFAGEDIWSSLTGNFTIRAVGAYSGNFTTTQPGTIATNSVGTGSNAKWRGQATITYSADTFTTALTWRYAGATRYSNLYVVAPQGGVPNSIDYNDIASRYYFNLNGDYKIPGMDNWRLYAGVNNLLNTAPPINAGAAFQPTTSNAQIYDLVGRTYNFGVRFNF